MREGVKWGRGLIQPWKFRKHDSDTVHPVGELYVRVWKPMPLRGRVVATPIFPPKVAKNNKVKNNHDNLDLSTPIDRSYSPELPLKFGLKIAELLLKNSSQILACEPFLAIIWQNRNTKLNEINTIWFVPFNYMFSANYKLVYEYMLYSLNV